MRRRLEYVPVNKVLLFSLFLIAAIAPGCALSPQIVDIRPDITVSADDINATGTAIGLEVTDVRKSTILGRRGGVYEETATISTGKDITLPLRESLTAALGEAGYRVVDDGPVQPLRVEVAALEYKVKKEKVTRTIETHASINAAYRKGDKTYSNSYRVTRTKKMLTAPGMDENETLINETLGAALQQMLRDRELFGLINQ